MQGSRLAAWALAAAVVLGPTAARGAGDEEPPPRDRAILGRLDRHVDLKVENVPLETVLKLVKEQTRGPDDAGIPIYVDPDGLTRAGATMQTTFSVESGPGERLDGVLRRMLRSKNLDFVVKDGLFQVVASRLVLIDRGPQTRAIRDRLERRVDLTFDKTPLQDVLKEIKSRSKGPNDSGIPIYVDPVGLQEAEVTMLAPVTIDAKGQRLKDALRKALKPLGLVYQVKDGLLTITSEEAEDTPIGPPEGADARKGGAPH